MPDTIRLPAAITAGHFPVGLTASSLRLALMLIASADAMGRFNLLKPGLERAVSVRMDNAASKLRKIEDAVVLDFEGPPIRIFDSIAYVPGEQKRLAGVVWGHLSTEFRTLIADKKWHGRHVEGSVGELGRLTTAPGIVLWLHLLPLRAGGKAVRLRLKEEDVAGIFGSYRNRAIIQRKNAEGEVFEWTSLSRMFDDLIKPAVKDMWSALDGWIVDAAPGVPAQRKHGRAWTHIDISIDRVEKRRSLRDLAGLSRRDDAYQLRKNAVR